MNGPDAEREGRGRSGSGAPMQPPGLTALVYREQALPIVVGAGGADWDWRRLLRAARPIDGTVRADLAHDGCGFQARRSRIVYALAERLGWSGPASEAHLHGLATVRAGLSDDGLYGAWPRAGGVLDGMGLLYEQAFVLLALAAAHARTQDAAIEAEALALLEARERFRPPARRVCRGAGPRLAFLFANPNMHLFELPGVGGDIGQSVLERAVGGAG